MPGYIVFLGMLAYHIHIDEEEEKTEGYWHLSGTRWNLFCWFHKLFSTGYGVRSRTWRRAARELRRLVVWVWHNVLFGRESPSKPTHLPTGAAQLEREHHLREVSSPWGHLCLSSVYLSSEGPGQDGNTHQSWLPPFLLPDSLTWTRGRIGQGAEKGRIGQGMRQASHPGRRKDQEVRFRAADLNPMQAWWQLHLWSLPLGFIIQGQWCPPLPLLFQAR